MYQKQNGLLGNLIFPEKEKEKHKQNQRKRKKKVIYIFNWYFQWMHKDQHRS